ncbi:hypothetical protein ACFLRT_04670 [Acidobacteriota bacterium]
MINGDEKGDRKSFCAVLTFPGIGVIFEPGGIMASWQLSTEVSADVAQQLDQRIDRLVSRLYGLTGEEIAIEAGEIGGK